MSKVKGIDDPMKKAGSFDNLRKYDEYARQQLKKVMKRNRSSADNLRLKQVLEAYGIKADPKTDPMAVIEALIELAGKN